MLAENVHIQFLRFPSGIIRGEINFQPGYANPNRPELGVIPDAARCMAETPSLPSNVTIRPDERLHKLASISAGTPCHAPVMSPVKAEQLRTWLTGRANLSPSEEQLQRSRKCVRGAQSDIAIS